MKAIVGLILLTMLAGASSVARAAADNAVPDGFVFAAGGDMIGPYHPFPGDDDPGFKRVAALFQQADLGFANQEGSIFDMETFAGYPAAENGGGYPRQPQAAARSIRAMGIALVSKANNHATDWGAEGLIATLKNLSAAGIVQAGAGMSLNEARGAGFVMTAKGQAALVDTASTFPPMAVAGGPVDRRGVTSKPRPGISALHVREVRLVTAGQLEALRQMGGDSPAPAGDVRIGDQIYRVGAPGSVWEMQPDDEAAILASIRKARAAARFVLFSIHAHETAGDDDAPGPAEYEPLVLHKANEAPSPDDPRPAAFEPVLFHAAIDAGADAVVRTGPHVLNGVEIYKGRPIFYGLGSLFYDFAGRRSYTTPAGEVMNFPDEWFETMVPVTTYAGGQAREIKLYPMVIDARGPATAGVPHPADPARALKILTRIKAQSAVFGTDMRIEGGVGVIRLDRRSGGLG
jgi:poly-gamma-glutamate synthesis protein (capsule biosynthesis protein)